MPRRNVARSSQRGMSCVTFGDIDDLGQPCLLESCPAPGQGRSAPIAFAIEDHAMASKRWHEAVKRASATGAAKGCASEACELDKRENGITHLIAP